MVPSASQGPGLPGGHQGSGVVSGPFQRAEGLQQRPHRHAPRPCEVSDAIGDLVIQVGVLLAAEDADDRPDQGRHDHL